MKKKWLAMVAGCILTCTSGEAQVEDDIISQEQILTPQENAGDPFQVTAWFDWVGNSKIKREAFEDEHIKFREWQVKASAIFCYDPECEEGLIAIVDYDSVNFDWEQNPFFDQKMFNEVTFAIGGFSKRIDNWLWQAQAAINWDTRHTNFNLYTNYDLLLWGRYEAMSCFGIHTGFLMLTGMKIDHIYPVLGFDWTINDEWKLNLVFPMDMALVYKYSCNLSAAIAARFFDVRRRTGKDQPIPQALFEYRNTGIEFALAYDWESTVSVNAHVGSTLGGKVKITNREHKDPVHLKLDSAIYAGGEVNIKF